MAPMRALIPICFGQTDVLCSATGNFDVCNAAMLRALKAGAVVCNIGHFDNEIDTAYMRENWEWEEVKPQVHKVIRDRDTNDYLLLLAEGRLVNLGNATGHPSRIMDGSFANQVLAQIHLYAKRFADLPAAQKQAAISVDVLPKHLDEQVAALMVEGFAGVMTKLTSQQGITLALTSMVRSKTTVTSIEIRFSVAVNIAACAATEFILRHHSPQGRCVDSTSMQAITWRECSGPR
jgi:adenosylhomocysteinase